MARCVVVLAIVLHGGVVLASQHVQVSTRVIRIGNELNRAEWCGPRRHVRGCTRLVAVELAGEAVEVDGSWRIRPAARFIGVIALLDTSLYNHELLHVRDIEHAIESYLAELETASFTTRSACEVARDTARSEFQRRVQGFAKASDFLRDGFASE